MKDWTFMIYLSGDNNLSLDMAYSIEQIRLITATNQNINILVYFDGYSLEIPTLYADFSGPYDEHLFRRSYTIDDKLFKVSKHENENSSSMYNLLNFVQWGVNQVEYKEGGVDKKGRDASNYAMIFSGHSMGFQSVGLFQDSKANYNMTMPKLRWALDRMGTDEETLSIRAIDDEKAYVSWQKEVAKKRGETISDDKLGWSKEYRTGRTTEILGKNVALLGFDSCMMGMLEVGSQFTGVAETMVASEGSIPNAGWSYTQMLADVANGQSVSSSAAIACLFVEKYIKQQNRHAIGSISVDIAAWDLAPTKIEAIDTAFEALAAAMIACFRDKGDCFDQLKLALLSARFNCQSYTMQQNVDLVDLCDLLIREIRGIEKESSTKDLGLLTTVATKAEAVVAAVKDCILLSGFSGGKNQFSNGISIYFPWTKDSYCASLGDYLRLKFVDRSTDKEKVFSNWKTFLELYLSEVTYRRPPVVGAHDSSIIFESFTGDRSKEVEDKNCIERGNELHAERYPPYGRPGDRNPPYDVSNRNPPYDADNKNPPYDLSNRTPPYGRPGDRGLGDIVRGMTGAMGQFFDQYARVRNVETPWNIAGFSSTKIKLISRNSEGQRTTTEPSQASNLPEIVVPPGTRIKRRIEDLLHRFSDHDENDLAKVLYGMAEIGDEVALDKFILDLNTSLQDPALSWKDSLRNSFNKITDKTFQKEVVKRTGLKGN